jgi:geranylgeranyl diphosphate synthase type II
LGRQGFCHKRKVSATVDSFPRIAAHWAPRVDDALRGYVERLSEGCPDRLREAIAYSLLAPGKRLRPLLVLMSAEACGSEENASSLAAACAVEMVHCYSLVHDDLPAMDDDDLRRGRPTCHKVYGEGLAILVGDALLTLAFDVLAHDVHPASAAAACCGTLAQAAGAAALVGGQTDDLAGVEAASDLESLRSIHRRKTGAMFLASLKLGAITAGADAKQVAALTEYGEALGIAFQISDDLLDVEGNEANLGKRVGKDAGRGKLTYPGLLGIEESRQWAVALVDEACTALAVLGPRAASLEALARYVVERDR